MSAEWPPEVPWGFVGWMLHWSTGCGWKAGTDFWYVEWADPRSIPSSVRRSGMMKP